MNNHKAFSIILNILFYLAAIAIGILVYKTLGDDLHLLLRLLIADLAATFFIFCSSVIFNNSSMYDPYWSVKPMVIAFFYLFELGLSNAGLLHWSVFILLQLYGIRLTLNFYRNWRGLKHEDWRYVSFRKQFPKLYWLVSFFGIHLFPTIIVYLACLPLYSIFIAHSNLSAQPLIMTIGLVILTESILIAFVADEQMKSFRSKERNLDTSMNKELWKYSRHPNYFGEILTWWGIYIISLSLSTEMWYLGIGALSVNLMFIFISIPWLDKRCLETKRNFKEYVNSTRMLIPLPKLTKS